MSAHPYWHWQTHTPIFRQQHATQVQIRKTKLLQLYRIAHTHHPSIHTHRPMRSHMAERTHIVRTAHPIAKTHANGKQTYNTRMHKHDRSEEKKNTIDDDGWKNYRGGAAIIHFHTGIQSDVH